MRAQGKHHCHFRLPCADAPPIVGINHRKLQLFQLAIACPVNHVRALDDGICQFHLGVERNLSVGEGGYAARSMAFSSRSKTVSTRCSRSAVAEYGVDQ